jgi:hypothetical protein
VEPYHTALRLEFRSFGKPKLEKPSYRLQLSSP